MVVLQTDNTVLWERLEKRCVTAASAAAGIMRPVSPAAALC